MTNSKLLKATIVLNGDTVTELAEFLGINRQNLSVKVNGKREFKQSEIVRIVRRYKLTDQQVKDIFAYKEELK